MDIKIKVHGLEETFARLMHAGARVSDAARKTMHRGADRIVKEAKLNVPRDDAELEDSIRKEMNYTGPRGRLQIDIVMGGVVRGVNVDNYAMEVHENYEGMLRRGPGKNTLAKMEANPGRYIGSKFLARAVEAERDKLNKAQIDAIMKEWKL